MSQEYISTLLSEMQTEISVKEVEVITQIGNSISSNKLNYDKKQLLYSCGMMLKIAKSQKGLDRLAMQVMNITGICSEPIYWQDAEREEATRKNAAKLETCPNCGW